ncbi:hypothetical protein [Bacillus sp. FJAT-49736]|uniref:hypothetical protein n=1 Tax=Bacillus sp. FJAT-49736 TaxID=2833582 RepID=UPI001BCA0F05|nr:hypothetical protein [Bacillus sp. FJAT-49736]MBS4174107.1 hypothetical protein [Bacillus sp. FJAT-49736]
MDTKLIIVEGLPGFGKSTTANLLYDILVEKNIDVELILEGNLDHPADYEGVSCFDKSEFDRLLANSGKFREVMNDRVMKIGNDYLLPYRKIINEYSSDFPDHLLNTIYQNDIYELSLEKNMELITEKWKGFVQKASNENKMYIFECCFIQNPVTVGMIKYGVQKERVVSYVDALAGIIEKLNPILFYIEQDDLEYSFRKAVHERAKEWSAGFIEYYTNQGFGKMNGYSDIDGTINVLEARRELESEIFDKLNITKTRINNSQYEAAKYRTMIMEKLHLLKVLE